MSHSHRAGPVSAGDSLRRRRAMIGMLVVVVPVAIATALGLWLLWPSGHVPDIPVNDPTAAAPGVGFIDGTVSSVKPKPCDDGSGAGQKCADVIVDLGARGGSGSMYVPPEVLDSGIKSGDPVKVLKFPADAKDDSNDFRYIFVDFNRTLPLTLLAIAYAVVVIAVARLRGLRALVGLVVAYLVMVKFMLPALVDGESPLLVGLVASSAIMFVVLYLAHGVSARTTTALLGTLAGIGMTAALGAWAVDAANLSGVSTEDSYTLAAAGGVQLSALVLCGMVIAGLGVLNDVTITQASAVWELSESSPGSSPREVFARAMRIGRDHIASTVYTVAFAYAGAALPALMLISLYQRPLLQSLTFGELAEEVARTLVGSIGLVLAIPITTLIAVVVVGAVSRRPAAGALERPVPEAS